jgi:hypothetical protein
MEIVNGLSPAVGRAQGAPSIKHANNNPRVFVCPNPNIKWPLSRRSAGRRVKDISSPLAPWNPHNRGHMRRCKLRFFEQGRKRSHTGVTAHCGLGRIAAGRKLPSFLPTSLAMSSFSKAFMRSMTSLFFSGSRVRVVSFVNPHDIMYADANLPGEHFEPGENG